MFAGLRKISTFATANAEIAQLVEHNLAKVRVASSSLVLDAHVSGACVERHAGSSPVLGTKVGATFYEMFRICRRGGGIGRRATLRG